MHQSPERGQQRLVPILMKQLGQIPKRKNNPTSPSPLGKCPDRCILIHRKPSRHETDTNIASMSTCCKSWPVRRFVACSFRPSTRRPFHPFTLSPFHPFT